MTKFIALPLIFDPAWGFAQDAGPSPSHGLAAQAPAVSGAISKCPRFAPPTGSFTFGGLPVEVIVVTASLGRSPDFPAPSRPKDGSFTEIVAHVLSDGTVKSAAMLTSSGDPDLDGTVETCLVGAHLPQIMSDGRAIEADTTVSIGWPSGWISVDSETPPQLPPSDDAQKMYYPPLAVRMHHQGVAVLSFTISADGTVKNVVVTQSTGFAELDQASIAAASRFRFRCAVTQNGKLVDNDTKLAMIWRIQ